MPNENKDYSNSAVIKIISNHTREMSELQTKHNTLLEIHLETIKKYQAKSIELSDIKQKFIDDLDALEMTVVIWDTETHLHIQKDIEMGRASSGMVFMPDIQRLKFKWESKP